MGKKVVHPVLEGLPTLKIQVLYHKDGIVALNKPAGLDTFNTNYHRSGYPQMVDILRPYFPEGGPPHRIDRMTSGLHVWASTKEAISEISTSKGWKNAHKWYLCVAPSIPKWNTCEINMDVKSDEARIDKWKPCTTGLTRLNDSELVQAELMEGGRTHQIRKAMQAVGLPILGDKLYGGNTEDAPRFLLHAWKWSYHDILVQARLPKDMAAWEPGGFTRAKWSIEVPPLNQDQYDKLEHYRRTHVGGSLIWPELNDIKVGERTIRNKRRVAGLVNQGLVTHAEFLQRTGEEFEKYSATMSRHDS